MINKNFKKLKPTTNQSSLKAVPPTSETVLITGGAGFLGSALCDHYIGRGGRVICVDNLSTGRMQNIEHLIENDAFSFIKHDVSEPFDTPEDIGFIYNMASPASPPKYQIDPISTFRTIVFGAENMLSLAHRKGARILEASTSEIYGDPEVSPQSETYRGNVNTMGPRACYDEGKRAAETLFYDYHKSLGTDIRVARIFNTYGPRMDPEDGRVVSNFIVQALSDQDLTIFGDGSQTRSFCYVDDLIAGLVALMHAHGTLSEPVNLGNPGEFTVRELAEIVLEETQRVSQLEIKPLPVDDPKRRQPDITRAWKLLNWKPKVQLREGLRLTIPYFETELEQNPEVAKVAV